MFNPQYYLFIRWFLGVFIFIYILSAAINFSFDPFFKYFSQDESNSNYKISQPYNEILTKLSLVKQQNAKKFIFGDSRGNVFTDEIVESVAAGSWYNFSIGGASPIEVISLVEYTLETVGKDKIEHFIIVLPIRLFVDRRVDRFSEAKDLLESNFLYLTNTLVLKASMANALYHFSGTQLKSQKQPGSKEEVWKYWIKHADLRTRDWQIPTRTMKMLNTLFEHLRKEDIHFTIILPPIHNDIIDTYSKGMPEIWQTYLSFYQQFPETLSCLDSSYNTQSEMFKDPYHSDGPYSELVFNDIVNTQYQVCR